MRLSNKNVLPGGGGSRGRFQDKFATEPRFVEFSCNRSVLMVWEVTCSDPPMTRMKYLTTCVVASTLASMNVFCVGGKSAMDTNPAPRLRKIRKVYPGCMSTGMFQFTSTVPSGSMTAQRESGGDCARTWETTENMAANINGTRSLCMVVGMCGMTGNFNRLTVVRPQYYDVSK